MNSLLVFIPFFLLISGITISSMDLAEFRPKPVLDKKIERELCLEWQALSFDEMSIKLPKNLQEIAASVACFQQSLN